MALHRHPRRRAHCRRSLSIGKSLLPAQHHSCSFLSVQMAKGIVNCGGGMSSLDSNSLHHVRRLAMEEGGKHKCVDL